MGACAGLCVCSCPTAVPDAVLVVVALCKSPLVPDVGRKFICSSSNVADMVVPTLDNRGNIKTQTMPYLCLFEACVFAKQETTCQRRCEQDSKTSTCDSKNSPNWTRWLNG